MPGLPLRLLAACLLSFLLCFQCRSHFLFPLFPRPPIQDHTAPLASPHLLSTTQTLLSSELQAPQFMLHPHQPPSLLKGHLCEWQFPKPQTWGPLPHPHIQPILSAINNNDDDDNNDNGENDSWHLWASYMAGTPNTLYVLPPITFPHPYY